MLYPHDASSVQNMCYFIVFNGEIYNYIELRKMLKDYGYFFFTQSDTEVLLTMFVHFGSKMIQYLNGMFAFAIYDTQNDLIFIARDRLGIKPLYYAHTENGFVFGSEIKAILASGMISSEPDPVGLDIYFARRYCTGGRTAYKKVQALKPGCFMTVDADYKISLQRYWDFPNETTDLDKDEIQFNFTKIINSSVNYRLISDVPLGVFLSGGIDSTAIASIMHSNGQSPIQSFTIGFSDSDPDVIESRTSSQFLSCEQQIEYITHDDFLSFPKLLQYMDSPYGDPILLALFVLCRNASKQVKVVLSGDGADETQMGYIHHETISLLCSLNKYCPVLISTLIGKILSVTPVSLLDKFFSYPDSMGNMGRARLRNLLYNANTPGDSFQNFANIFSKEERLALYGPKMKRGLEEALEVFFNPEQELINGSNDPLRAIYLHDLKYWLPDNILTKFDRMSMAASIEGRVPFLDHRLVEFLVRLPMSNFLYKHKGKQVLKKYFSNNIYIPGRKTKTKRAFYFPMRGGYYASLRQLVTKYLNPSEINGDYLNPEAVEHVVKRARGSELLGGKQLFSLAAFNMWLKEFE